jgi:hypothetical protein
LPSLERRLLAVKQSFEKIADVGHVAYDDPDDTGIAGVDIYKMDADGKAIEHWDTLQVVGDPKNSAPLIAPNIPRANPTGCSEREHLASRSLFRPGRISGAEDGESRGARAPRRIPCVIRRFDAVSATPIGPI